MVTTKQPEVWSRAKPATTSEGKYFRIVVRNKSQFTSFRTQDVGRQGGIQRLAGRRSSGSWDTQTWLISKDHAHIEGNRLVPDSNDAKALLKSLGGVPKHQKDDIFIAKATQHTRKSQPYSGARSELLS